MCFVVMVHLMRQHQGPVWRCGQSVSISQPSDWPVSQEGEPHLISQALWQVLKGGVREEKCEKERKVITRQIESRKKKDIE